MIISNKRGEETNNMRQKCKVMFKIQYTLMTVTRNLFSSSSCMAPLIDPTAQHN